MKTIRVEAPRPYDVMIGYDMLPSLGEALAERHRPCRIALVCDETVDRLFGQVAVQSLERAGYVVHVVHIEPGEAAKCLETVTGLLGRFMELGLTRSDLALALGGGITGDITGFAAAVYLRGIQYVQVPTTLLAAVDSSVGGKTGVNLDQGKNLVGAYWHPLFVLCDCSLFMTLPHDIFLDGVAESLKYGAICDRALFEKVAQGSLDGDCLDTVARCIEIKAQLVADDERDQGKRQLLNYGHTIGHAIEKLSDYEVSHGHAIAMGMVGAARIAEALGICVMGCAGLMMAMMDRLGLPAEIPYDAGALATVAMRDKKRQGEQVTLILPEAIGHCILYPVEISMLPKLIRAAKGERL